MCGDDTDKLMTCGKNLDYSLGWIFVDIEVIGYGAPMANRQVITTDNSEGLLIELISFLTIKPVVYGRYPLISLIFHQQQMLIIHTIML